MYDQKITSFSDINSGEKRDLEKSIKMNLQLIHTRVINAGEEIYSYIDISILFIFVMEACMRERNYIVVYKLVV